MDNFEIEEEEEINRRMKRKSSQIRFLMCFEQILLLLILDYVNK